MKTKSNNLEKIWSQVPADYYETGIKTNLFQWIWHSRKLFTIRKILQQQNISPPELLDIGCASGLVTARLAEFLPGSKVTGLDVYDPAIKLGRKLHPKIKFIKGNIYNIPYKSSTFDFITCVETLEHLDNPDRAVKEIKRVLKNNGKLLIGQDTDNLPFQIIWFFWIKTRGRVWKNSHVSPLTPKLLEKILKKNGFKVMLKKTSAFGLEVFLLAEKRG